MQKFMKTFFSVIAAGLIVGNNFGLWRSKIILTNLFCRLNKRLFPRKRKFFNILEV